MSDSVSSADLMPPPQTSVPLAKAMLLTAMAGGMGWGIRGQYGHETGAMIAGVLVAVLAASSVVASVRCKALPKFLECQVPSQQNVRVGQRG